MKVKIGVLGCGNMGKTHARILSTLNNLYDLIGVYDSNLERAQIVAKLYNTVAFKSADDLINQVDGVVIATPSITHREYGLYCLEKKKHVLIEKPLAATLKEAEAVAELAREASQICMVGHVETFNPVTNELKKILKNEEVLSFDFHRLSPFDERVADVDVVKDLMIHDVYNLQYLIGNCGINNVQSHGCKVYSDKIDYAQTLVSFDNGIVASLTASRITESKKRVLEISTKGAYIVVDYINRSIDIARKTRYKLDLNYVTEYVQENIVEKVFVPMKEPLVAELEHFAKSILTGEKVNASQEEGLKAVALCERILKGVR